MGREWSCTNLWRRYLPDPAKMGRASGYISGRFAIGSSDFLLLRRRWLRLHWPRSLLAVDTPRSWTQRPRSARLIRLSTRPSIAAVPVSFAAAIRWLSRKSLKEQIGILMPRHYCGSCRSPLHADDGHSECVSCLGKSHADAALSGSDCSHCESISLASLRSRIAFFSESDPATRALPFSSSQGPVRKNSRAEVLSARLRASSRRLRSRVPRFHHAERCLPSFFPNLISVPLQAWAIWSRSGEVTTSWPMTACHW